MGATSAILISKLVWHLLGEDTYWVNNPTLLIFLPFPEITWNNCTTTFDTPHIRMVNEWRFSSSFLLPIPSPFFLFFHIFCSFFLFLSFFFSFSHFLFSFFLFSFFLSYFIFTFSSFFVTRMEIVLPGYHNVQLRYEFRIYVQGGDTSQGHGVQTVGKCREFFKHWRVYKLAEASV